MEQLHGPDVVALVGDSHAIQYEVGLSILLHGYGSNMELLTKPGCPILDGITLKRDTLHNNCIATRDQALVHLQNTTTPIIVDQYWSFYDDSVVDYKLADGSYSALQSRGSYFKLESALERTMEKLVKTGRKILLIGAQVNANCHFDRARLYQGPLPHARLAPCLPGERESAEKSGAQMNDLLARVQSKWPENIELLRPIDYLCHSECPTMKDGLWLYFDDTHFSVAGSRYMVHRAETPITQFLALH
jgi:hypothetical protein